MSLRDEFPVLRRIAYMNAGTDGPVPARAASAGEAAVRTQLERGRAGKRHFDEMGERRDALRGRAAAVLGCAPDQVALTHSATDGMNLVLHGLRLRRGDEIVTSDEEHPGLLAPLFALARESGVDLRFAPFAEIANAVTHSTRLIACSHVSWITGKVIDTEALRETGVPILYDGAQALGAIPVDVTQLGCAFYASAGQKWLCGPDQSGYLYVHPAHVDALGAPWPGYQSLADAERISELPLADGARRFDTGWPAPHDAAWALAAFEVFEEHGWPAIHEQAAANAESLATALRDRGAQVAPRDRSTLVSWHDPDPEGFVKRAAAAGIGIRYLPGRGLVRASIGAWNNDDDLDKLLALIANS